MTPEELKAEHEKSKAEDLRKTRIMYQLKENGHSIDEISDQFELTPLQIENRLREFELAGKPGYEAIVPATQRIPTLISNVAVSGGAGGEGESLTEYIKPGEVKLISHNKLSGKSEFMLSRLLDIVRGLIERDDEHITEQVIWFVGSNKTVKIKVDIERQPTQ